MRVAIVGAGDLGAQLTHHAGALDDMEIAGFFDDMRDPGSLWAGRPVLGRIGDATDAFRRGAFDRLLIGVGYRHMARRQALFDELGRAVPFARLVHPGAQVDRSATIGDGAVVYPGCVVDMDAEIGPNALLNVGCVIAHHSRIGAGCFLSPAVKVAGFVSVDPMVSLGIGTVIIDNIRIVSGVRTGAGAVVIDDIGEPGLYVGVPARFKKSLES